MEINQQFGQLADEATVQKTVAALQQNGITALLVRSGAEAKQKVLALLPRGSAVMNMTSMTLESLSVVKEVLESGSYNATRNQLSQLGSKKDAQRKQELGAAPPYVVGSVHAVTQQGEVFIASNTGSQLPAYAYGAAKVIWVVGTHKIVKDRAEGLRRLYEYSLPLEDQRAQQAYGQGSNVSKILIINKEVQENRITLIFVQEKIGF
ncbi:MAG TPA: LUD domain-containing protein [Candidatus Andersenbacteria bacterium]|nr:LUD domain-containing protein [Candidatus Andersenbacteria bacterium]